MTVPFLDPADLRFDVTSEAVHAARDDSWCAETPCGWAILRYDEGTALRKDRMPTAPARRPRPS